MKKASQPGGMLRPQRMKLIELTALSRDIDAVIELLGRRGIMHFSDNENTVQENQLKENAGNADAESYKINQENLNRLQTACAYLSVPIPSEPEEDSIVPGEAEEALISTITDTVSSLSKDENTQKREKQKIQDTLNEIKAFANLDAPFSELDQLSYLTLRVGRLDPRNRDSIGENLAERAVVVPLDEDGDRVMAAASRKGRFALDSELKKAGFTPINIPEGFKGVPAELLLGLMDRLEKTEAVLADIDKRKTQFRNEYGDKIRSLISSCIMAGIMKQLKARAVFSKDTYLISGWVPANAVTGLVAALDKAAGGRVAVRSYNPNELPGIKEGREKVPVSLKHRTFVKGFESVIFSYGVPLYGTIDPTFFVAIFYTLMFGIMFGDLGQGAVLLILGILTGKYGPAFMARFRKFSIPLISVGLASMVMGFLEGEIFTNDKLLAGASRAVSGFLTGNPVDRILVIIPLADQGGSVTKLFYFFGFTVSIGVILNSIGLIINIVNQAVARDYRNLLFSKTGIAGAVFFWYAISLGVRAVIGLINPGLPFKFSTVDLIILAVPVAFIVFNSVIWQFAKRKRPIFEDGVLVFVVEGIVEILETVSTNFSNTASFLRVGAFALSHAVLSFIIFRFSGQLSTVAGGTFFSLLIMLIGNSIIILLEGLIVAIQAVRLQYYEFFSKFFTETGIMFKPFRFRNI